MKTQGTLPEIRKTVVLNAPIEKVWKAIATSEGIASWWMPNTFEPILGRDFILHAGQFGDSPCKVTEIDPPNRVGFNWGKDWHLTFELKKLEDGKTEFTLIHSVNGNGSVAKLLKSRGYSIVAVIGKVKHRVGLNGVLINNPVILLSRIPSPDEAASLPKFR